MWISRWALLGEVAVECESTADGSEIGKSVHVVVKGVVGNLESTSNGLQERHGHVGEVGVGDKGKRATDVGDVGALDKGELVVVETERTVNGLEGRRGVSADIAQSHVVGPHQVGEDDGDVVSVGLNGQSVGDVAELHGDVLEVGVVGDVDSVDNLEVDSVEGGELGVLDVQLGGGLDTSAEGETLESRESLPGNGANIGELGEAQGRQNGQAVEVELVSDGLERASRDLSDLSDIVGNQATLDLLDAVEGNAVGGASGNGNATSEGGARCEGRCITSVLNGRGGSAARALG